MSLNTTHQHDELSPIIKILNYGMLIYFTLGFLFMMFDYWKPSFWIPNCSKSGLVPFKEQLKIIPTVIINFTSNYLIIIVYHYFFNSYQYKFLNSIINYGNWRFLISFILVSLWGYVTHILMHKPYFYWMHKKHHEYQYPFGIMAYYISPIENFVLVVVSYFIITFFLTLDELLVAVCLNSFYVVTSHCGHHFKFIPYIINDDHDLHHHYFTNNYGFFTPLLDILFKTYRRK
jgi:lathosterol oxidase